MADGFYSKTTSDNFGELFTTIEALILKNNQVLETLQDISTWLISLESKDTTGTPSRHSFSHLSPALQEPRLHEYHFHLPYHKFKKEVPRFDGTNPMAWIFKINQFFNFHNTLEDQRIAIASFYMDGIALNWFNGRTTMVKSFLNKIFYLPFKLDLHLPNLMTLKDGFLS